jgi:hypothetical protein
LRRAGESFEQQGIIYLQIKGLRQTAPLRTLGSPRRSARKAIRRSLLSFFTLREEIGFGYMTKVTGGLEPFCEEMRSGSTRAKARALRKLVRFVGRPQTKTRPSGRICRMQCNGRDGQI